MPVYRRKSGLQITPTIVKYAVVRPHRRTYRVLHTTKLAIKTDADKSRAFEIIRRGNFVPSDKLVVSYPTDIHHVEAIFPKLSDKELLHAIELNAEKYLTDKPESVVYDFKVTHRFMEDHTLKQRVFIFSLPKDKLESELSLLRTAHIFPYRLSDASFALWNLAACTPELPPNTLLVNIDTDYTIMVYIREGKLWFSRTIPLGVSSLLKDLQLTISLPEGRVVVIDADRASELLEKYGIPEPSDETTEEGIPFSMFRTFHRPFIEKISIELNRTINYISSTFNRDIDAIFITGDGASIKNLVQSISEEFTIPCNEYNIDHIFPAESKSTLHEFAIPLGLAIDVNNVNLLPRALEYEWHAILYRRYIKLLAVLSIPVLISIYGLLHLQETILKERMTSLSIQYNNAKITANEFISLVEKRDNLRKRLQSLPNVPRTPPYVGILKLLSNITPPNLQLTKLELSDHHALISGMVAGTDVGLELQLSQFLLNLNQSPYFSAITLLNKSHTTIDGIPCLTFDIECKIK